MQSLTIRAIQSDILWENPKGNLDKLSAMLNNAEAGELVVLPEMFATGFSMRPDKTAQPMDGEIVSWMKENSQDKLICGSVAIVEGGNYYNRFLACFEGEVISTYDKRHLFSFAGEDKHYTAGNSRIVFTYKGWKIKPLICYDLRFPVWCRNTEEADLMIFCANWPAVRIQAWNALLPARAIENQCFVVGVNRVGVDGVDNIHNGNSQLLDPLGNCLLNLDENEAHKTVMLEKEKLHSIRMKFPFLSDAEKFTLT
jgi:predicted amidohydrolase